MDVVTEALLSYCKIRPGSIRMVTQREVYRRWKKDGQPGPVPDLSKVGGELQQALAKRARQVWKDEALRAMLSPSPAEAAPEPARAAPTKEGDEARVAMMKGAEALALVAKHGLAWPGPHPTNPGITAMRAKNALYTHVRHGGSL
jgi:hypothetical protein